MVDTPRGSIYDRNGKLLAGEGRISTIGLVPKNMNSNPEWDIKRISELLNITEDEIKNKLSASYVKEDTFVELAKIPESDTNTEKELMKLAGIKIKTADERIYPYKEATSSLIGYVKKITTKEEQQANFGKGYNIGDVIGEVGLEKAYEERLKGLNGYKIYVVDQKGNRKKTIISRESKKGEDIKLTIDINVQKAVYNQFKNDESASVVLNPKTGEILAMCSTPTYDSNDFILGFSRAKWDEIVKDQREPLYNRCLATWVPGSSLKPIIGAIGLTENAVTAEEDFGRSGTKWQKDTSWGTYNITTVKTYSGPANLRNALIYSDNIYFAKLALKIGEKTLKTSLNKIGFNQSINSELSISSSKFIDGDKFESEIQLADTGYGQGKVLVNPLHIASMYTAFVNDGNMIKPYIEYKEGTIVPEYYVENAFTKEAANSIKDDLIQVIEDENGTAHSAKISGITLAGKTGTAEIKKTQDDKEGSEIGWFNAFVADEEYKKQVLIVSMVEDVHTKAQKGYVTSSVKKILQNILK